MCCLLNKPPGYWRESSCGPQNVPVAGNVQHAANARAVNAVLHPANWSNPSNTLKANTDPATDADRQKVMRDLLAPRAAATLAGPPKASKCWGHALAPTATCSTACTPHLCFWCASDDKLKATHVMYDILMQLEANAEVDAAGSHHNCNWRTFPA